MKLRLITLTINPEMGGFPSEAIARNPAVSGSNGESRWQSVPNLGLERCCPILRWWCSTACVRGDMGRSRAKACRRTCYWRTNSPSLAGNRQTTDRVGTRSLPHLQPPRHLRLDFQTFRTASDSTPSSGSPRPLRSTSEWCQAHPPPRCCLCRYPIGAGCVWWSRAAV